jgi:hypothetical protein
VSSFDSKTPERLLSVDAGTDLIITRGGDDEHRPLRYGSCDSRQSSKSMLNCLTMTALFRLKLILQASPNPLLPQGEPVL